MRYELMMMEKEYVPLVESKALTDETTVIIIGDRHLPPSAFESVPDAWISSRNIIKGSEDNEKLKQYLTEKEIAAGKTNVVLVQFHDKYKKQIKKLKP